MSLAPYIAAAEAADPIPLIGQVVRSVGLLVESRGPRAQVGELCELQQASGRRLMLEVVGFRDGFLQTVPLGTTAGIRPGDVLVARGGSARVPVGPELLGRVLDGLGQPLDGLGPIRGETAAPLCGHAAHAGDQAAAVVEASAIATPSIAANAAGLSGCSAAGSAAAHIDEPRIPSAASHADGKPKPIRGAVRRGANGGTPGARRARGGIQ